MDRVRLQVYHHHELAFVFLISYPTKWWRGSMCTPVQYLLYYCTEHEECLSGLRIDGRI